MRSITPPQVLPVRSVGRAREAGHLPVASIRAAKKVRGGGGRRVVEARNRGPLKGVRPGPGGASKCPTEPGLGVHLTGGPGVVEFTAEALGAYVLPWSKRKNKVASIACDAIAKDKIPPPWGVGWVGACRARSCFAREAHTGSNGNGGDAQSPSLVRSFSLRPLEWPART